MRIFATRKFNDGEDEGGGERDEELVDEGSGDIEGSVEERDEVAEYSIDGRVTRVNEVVWPGKGRALCVDFDVRL